jgi:hypothetical protein
VTVLGANSFLYNDNSTDPDVTYSYRVIAVWNGLNSAASNVVNVTTPNIADPDEPSDLIINLLSETSILTRIKICENR